MLVEFGKANLIDKARQQPDKVKQVLDKIKTDGLQPTLEAVFNKLGQPLPLGYCNVGRVVAVGKGVAEFQVGDRVASNGNHAEFVCVPKNLVAKVPDDITDEEAAFTVIGSIGLQGIRLLNPQSVSYTHLDVYKRQELLLKYPAVNWKDIKGMRDIIVHHYFDIDASVILYSLQKEVPDLYSTICVMLRDLSR